jgi:GNAT superfamily N-acetyltransferase
MDVSARRVDSNAIAAWRELYRAEMACQIVHDSIHIRRGWTQEYALALDGNDVGYGSVAVAGPWSGKPTLYEFYVVRGHRVRLFDLFEVLIQASRAQAIEVQSNDQLATVMLHTFATDVRTEAIVFEDRVRTEHAPPGARFRRARQEEVPDATEHQLPWRGVVEVDGAIAGSGGVLFHYTPPYGDIYMEVAEPFRRRGLGSFLVQELKRLCYQRGCFPAARCNPSNIASRRTLQKAGLVPCAHILTGVVRL